MQVSNKVIFLILTLLFLLIGGTFVFHRLEGWNYVDSFYFSTMTLTTIGYGDLHPTMPLTKIIVSFYALYGVAIVLYILTLFISNHMNRQEQRFFSYLGKIKSTGLKIPLKRRNNQKNEYIELKHKEKT